MDRSNRFYFCFLLQQALPGPCMEKTTAVLAPEYSYGRASQSGHAWLSPVISVMLVRHDSLAKAGTQALSSSANSALLFFLRALCEREGARILPRFSGIMMGIYDMRCRF